MVSMSKEFSIKSTYDFMEKYLDGQSAAYIWYIYILLNIFNDIIANKLIYVEQCFKYLQSLNIKVERFINV